MSKDRETIKVEEDDKVEAPVEEVALPTPSRYTREQLMAAAHPLGTSAEEVAGAWGFIKEDAVTLDELAKAIELFRSSKV